MRVQSSRWKINKEATSTPSNRVHSKSIPTKSFKNLSNKGDQHSPEGLAQVLVDTPQTSQHQELSMNWRRNEMRPHAGGRLQLIWHNDQRKSSRQRGKIVNENHSQLEITQRPGFICRHWYFLVLYSATLLCSCLCREKLFASEKDVRITGFSSTTIPRWTQLLLSRGF